MHDPQATKNDSGSIPIEVNTTGWTAEALAMFDAIARRAYELFEASGRQHGYDLEHWLRAESELCERPALTMAESQDGVTVLAEVAGFAPKELEVDLEPRRVIIIGKHPIGSGKKDGGSVSKQSESRMLMETLLLPVEVDTEHASAHLNRGVLELSLKKATMAKKAQAKPRPLSHVV